MLVGDVMSRNVVTVRPHMGVRAAAALLVANGFTSAPVVTAEGVLRGIVSGTDLRRGRPEQTDPEDTDVAPDTTAGEVMTLQPPTVQPADDIACVVELMRASGLRAVPVLDDGRLVGIVSRSDFLPGVDADLTATSRS